MKLDDAITYVDALIEEAKEDNGELYLDHVDIEALEKLILTIRKQREGGKKQ